MTPEPGGAPTLGDDPLLGTVLAGRYRLLEKLGEGGMGAVYRGVHETLRKPVAVKILPRAARANRELVTRFEREAVAAANLKHPGIAEVTDSGQTPDGTLFMVMEYVEGRTLHALMQQEGRLAPARALHLLRQIGAAVSFAHGREVVHRDLKPANMVVFDRGEERDLVKVIDFGIARMRSSFGGGNSGLTRAGTVVGTVEYMAPEQAMGQAVDPRADEYALGVIAFELLTGQAPYVSDDVASLVFMHVGAPIPAVSSRAPDLAAYHGLDEAVAKMMGKLPDERFASVSEAVAALAVAVEGQRLTATGASLPMGFTMGAPPPNPRAEGSLARPASPSLLQAPAAGTPVVTSRGTVIAMPASPPVTMIGAPRMSAPAMTPAPIPGSPPARRGGPPFVLLAVIAGATLLALLFLVLGIYLWSSPSPDPAPAPSFSAVPAEAPTEPSMLMPSRPPPRDRARLLTASPGARAGAGSASRRAGTDPLGGGTLLVDARRHAPRRSASC